MTLATLLVELVTEELPPKALKGLSAAFADALAAHLRNQDFLTAESTVTTFGTPRRLAVAITAVRAVAPDKPFKEKLLPVSVAFDAQ
ncbi:MAG: glycine--tRNA ligase subunit beta, partial [Casimicrobiaceae bacterium]